MNLLIVGSVAYDTVETPFGKAEKALGGTATFGSVSASYFAKPGIVGVVGNDFDRKHINLLKKRGVDLEGLQVDPSGKTFHWSGYYEGDMNQAITRDTQLNVFESFQPTLPESYRKAPFLFLGNILPGLQLEVLDQMKDPELILCDSMNLWIETQPKELEKVFRRSDVICINDSEVRQFCNTSTISKAAKELLKLGATRVIIKLGGYGVQLYGKDTFFALPALPLSNVKDPTGAGDTFAGGFIGRLAKSRTLNENAFRRALATGTVMASYCVQDFSCRKTANLKPSDIEKRLTELKQITRWS
ncbi:MAG: bifunctional hydroxymethylpyrimidine kinase/phosphomethylpyrimidine kinase [candidate division Zixibacteria bacterium]|nr:bifunctional hydroxymethylpyrimidine kinase/phosphomethylpyrimidine kinase [candidate division Zixibacteria bacterium]